MKAEHRKELETNELADRMGRLVDRVKHRPQGRGFFYLVLIGILVGVLFYFWYLNRQSALVDSVSWFRFDMANQNELAKLARVNESDSKSFEEDVAPNVRKAARFQLAWTHLWEDGIRRLGANPLGAMLSLKRAEIIYDALAKECEGDPVWQPEALYNLAVITETRAVQNRDNLDKAIDKFKAVAKTHKESGYGRLAQERANYLTEHLASMKAFYERLQNGFQIEGEGDGLPKLNLPTPPPIK